MLPVWATHRLLNLSTFSPNIGDEQSFAVSTNRVLQTVCQLCLSEWYVVSSLVSKSYNSLLKERQRLVDVHCFLLRLASRLVKDCGCKYIRTVQLNYTFLLYQHHQQFPMPMLSNVPTISYIAINIYWHDSHGPNNIESRLYSCMLQFTVLFVK